MASMDQFIAFKAAIDLLKERDMKDVIARAYNKSKDQVGLPKEQMVNYVKEIYAPFTNEEIAAKLGERKAKMIEEVIQKDKKLQEEVERI